MRPVRRTSFMAMERLDRRVLMSAAYTVTSIHDSGAGTLRAAILAANSNTTTQTTIKFDLPGKGVRTISPLSALPAITGQVDIQGTTNLAGNPLIELNGSDAGASAVGLTFNRAVSPDTKPSTVSGLIVDDFHNNAIDISGNAPTTVFGCRLGTDPTGEVAHPNTGDGVLVDTPNCQIGLAGKGPAFQNVISGNGGEGIEILSGGADCTIQNCLIGLDAKGISALPNQDIGVVVGAAFATIGGRRANQGNVISGNAGDGIDINFGNDDILGNLIGTNAAGTAILPNGTGAGGNAGINMAGVVNVSIGDSTALGRNVICVGPGGVGIGIGNSQCTINNDLIGTDITGDQLLAPRITVGVQTVVENGLDGVQVGVNTSDDVIENCVIGGFGNGVETNNDSNITVMNCDIGISADLKHVLTNEDDGIEFFESSNCTAESNTIADNVSDGIDVTDEPGFASLGDRIIQNSIFSNGELGINLGQDENNTPLPNHAGNVAGPNHDENYPVLSSAVEHDNATFISGTLSSTPHTDMLVEFFASAAADPSGFGEGQTLIGSAGLTTDGNGNASFTNFQADVVKAGQVITATAINTGSANSTNGDTSEFSQAISVTGTSISGTVFDDINGNGKQDAGEPGLKGRTVFADTVDNGLLSPTEEVSATTDAHGHFTLLGVPAGKNRLRMIGTAGWQQTFPAPKSASQVVSVVANGTTGGVLFGQKTSTAKAATLAVDAGSFSPYVDLSGQTWAADTQNPQNGFSYLVAGTDDDPLYYAMAEAPKLDYTFAVPNGKYTMKLLFTDGDSTAAGQRTFNVTANGATVLKHFDVFAAAGAQRTAVSESFHLTISNKTLSLVFKGIVGSAIISGIELVPT